MESEYARDAGVPACTQLLPCALSGSLFGCGRQPDVCSTALKVAMGRLNRGTTEWFRLCQIDLFLKRDFFFLSAEVLSVVFRAAQAAPGENVAPQLRVGQAGLRQLLSWSYQPLRSPPKQPYKAIFSLLFLC